MLTGVATSSGESRLALRALRCPDLRVSDTVGAGSNASASPTDVLAAEANFERYYYYYYYYY